MKKEWTLKSWKEYKAAQQPDWETAKNYSSVIPLCHASQYEGFMNLYNNSNGIISEENRLSYA